MCGSASAAPNVPPTGNYAPSLPLPTQKSSPNFPARRQRETTEVCRVLRQYFLQMRSSPAISAAINPTQIVIEKKTSIKAAFIIYIYTVFSGLFRHRILKTGNSGNSL